MPRDLAGRDGSLRTYSALQQVDTKVLHQNDNQALVRATLQYATAVGAIYDTRDLKVVKEGDELEGRMAGSERSRRCRRR